MKRPLIAASIYFLMLFVAPKIGVLSATLMEVPLMLAAAFFMCRRAIIHWQVPPTLSARGAMVLWLLVLLALFETLVGVALFDRTLAGTWAGLVTPAGLIGLTAQIIAAILPLFVGRSGRR